MEFAAELLRQFKIRTRMIGAIAMVLALFALVGLTGVLSGRQLASLNDEVIDRKSVV